MSSDTYHPLFEHLLYNGHGELRMTFTQVERLLGRKLPPSARLRASWWSNNASGHSQASGGWLRAGYRTREIDLVKGRVTFRLEGWPDGYRKLSFAGPRGAEGMAELDQVELEPSPSTASLGSTADEPQAERPHPAWGIWAGKVTLLPDHDYTQPADPDWGRVYAD